MNDLEDRAEQAITGQQLLSDQDRVLVGVSGGADSMVLFHLLHQLGREHGWSLEIAHFNHRLRGRSSDADERLVRRLAAESSTPIHVSSADVRVHARKQKLSIEMAARQLRHEFFVRIARKWKIQKLALAHHKDDQIELFFLRLLRGSAPEGLTGMAAIDRSFIDSSIRIIRPLLNVSKRDILQYASEHKIQFREDASNASVDMLRNRIRRELLPLLRRKYQPALDGIVMRLIEILRAESEFVAEAAQDASGPNLHVALQRRLIHAQLCDTGIDPSFEMVEFLRRQPGQKLNVAPGVTVAWDGSRKLTVSRVEATPTFSGQRQKIILKSKNGTATFGDMKIHWAVTEIPNKKELREKPPNCEYFDAEKFGKTIVLRRWAPGDRFHAIGMSTPVKLQDIFTNEKIPRQKRHELVVAEDGKEQIFWVEGLRISERHKIRSGMRRALQWRWSRQSSKLQPPSYKKAPNPKFQSE